LLQKQKTYSSSPNSWENGEVGNRSFYWLIFLKKSAEELRKQFLKLFSTDNSKLF